METKIAIFASGSGTNAENIILYFRDYKTIRVSLVYCNNPDAGVIKRAQRLQVPVFLFDRKSFYDSDDVFDSLIENEISWIVLAGFLWLIPKKYIDYYKNKIVNIHPALLPDYGGKGMYGMKVHQEVIKKGERKSGITIHFVDEQYDQGQIIFQAPCEVEPDDTPESLAKKIHQLEYENYPRVIERLLAN